MTPIQSTPSITADLRSADTLAAAASQRELDLAASSPGDHEPATLAHRAGIRRVLAEINAAQARLDTGHYGVCTACRVTIPPERLELRPWTPHCVTCAGKAAQP